MKQKIWKKTVALGITAALMISQFCIVLANDLEDKKDDIQQQIEDNKNDQEVLQQELDLILDQISDLQSEIDRYNTENINLQDEMHQLDEQMADKQIEIDGIQAQYDKQYADMKLRIQYMYENGDTQFLDLLLNSESFADFLNKAQYVSDIVQYDRDMLDQMEATHMALVKAKDELQAQKDSLAAKQKEVQQNMSYIAAIQEQKNELYQKRKDDLDTLITQYAGLEEDLAVVDAEIEAYAAEQERIRQEQQQKPSDGDAISSAGFIWPAPGCYQINDFFGIRSDPPGFHHGIDLQTGSGTPYVAVADGVVAFAGWSDAIGNYIMLDCNGIYAIYAHSSVLYASTGDYVTQGTVLGLTGNTGYQTTGAHLHFAIMVNNEYVDPLPYLN